MAEDMEENPVDKVLLRQAVLEYVSKEEQADKLAHLLDTLCVLIQADMGSQTDSAVAPFTPKKAPSNAGESRDDSLPSDLENYVDSVAGPSEPKEESTPSLVREEMKHSPYLSDFINGKGVRPLSIKNMDKMLSRMGFKAGHRSIVERKARTLGFKEHDFWNYIRIQSLATLATYGEVKDYLRVRKVSVPKVAYPGSQTYLERFSRYSLWAAYDRATMDVP